MVALELTYSEAWELLELLSEVNTYDHGLDCMADNTEVYEEIQRKVLPLAYEGLGNDDP